ncbi:uncharacterized protein KY384_006657 [Bacidia gigantensis]|uniref:uncharacterized protein n=1 Tax=Bacidia gigantensis TaxID=2732470 RepID=UPI001D03EBE4|nr:uncharacterized protein KY384_006657 [Bacidia gigantensis]KAG8528968.1 hypothetical protein KY384_006657 [Bacidia gigantensis]
MNEIFHHSAFMDSAQSLRLLSIDGGGIKGLTALIILRRLMRTVKVKLELAQDPKPCEYFDLIGGTSTGGLIAIMLGRLGLTVDQCIDAYQVLAQAVFGHRSYGGIVLQGLRSKSVYSISRLQEAIKETLASYGEEEEAALNDSGSHGCRMFVCASNQVTSQYELIRNYVSNAADQENYDCTVWEAGSATAAAPMYFDSVTFARSRTEFTDGGLNINCPVNELVNEATRIWPAKEIGCLVSLGTGWTQPSEIPKRLDKFLIGSVKMLTNAEKLVETFTKHPIGRELLKSNRFFRFNVEQGMDQFELDDWKELPRLSELTKFYLGRSEKAMAVERCAAVLIDPDRQQVMSKPSLLPVELNPNFVRREVIIRTLHNYFNSPETHLKRFILWADRLETFYEDYRKILGILDGSQNSDYDDLSPLEVLKQTREALERRPKDWFLVIDNADTFDLFQKQENDICLTDYLPTCGHTLLTSRDKRMVGELAAFENSLRVDAMEQHEAVQLLRKSIIEGLNPDWPKAHNQAIELLELLGHLPLAITQAAANMRVRSIDFSSYISQFKDRKSRIGSLQINATIPKGTPQSVLVVWEMSFDNISNFDTVAITLLYHMGFYFRSDIPERILRKLPDISNLSETRFKQALDRLSDFALIDTSNRDQHSYYQIHPMVQLWITQRISIEERLKYLGCNVALCVRELPPYPTSSNKAIRRVLAPHALELSEHGQELQMSNEPFCLLLHTLISYLKFNDCSRSALQLNRHAYQLTSTLWKGQHSLLFILDLEELSILTSLCLWQEAADCGLRMKQKWEAYDLNPACKPALDHDLILPMKMIGREEEALGFINQGAHTRIEMKPSASPKSTLRLEAQVSKGSSNKDTTSVSKEDDLTTYDSDEYTGLEKRAELLRKEGKTEEAFHLYTKAFERAIQTFEPSSHITLGAAVQLCATASSLHRYRVIDVLVQRVECLVQPDKLEGVSLLQYALLILQWSISLQHRRKYQDAVKALRSITQRCDQLEVPDPDSNISIMLWFQYALALGNAGQKEAMEKLRQSNPKIAQAEKLYGNIEDLVKIEPEIIRTYHTGLTLLLTGTAREGEWWDKSSQLLKLGEERYGNLEDQVKMHKAKGNVDAPKQGPLDSSSPETPVRAGSQELTKIQRRLGDFLDKLTLRSRASKDRRLQGSEKVRILE